MSNVQATTFLGSAPLWALSATYEAGLSARDVTEAKITPKTATLTFADGTTAKVFRRNAFPPRVK